MIWQRWLHRRNMNSSSRILVCRYSCSKSLIKTKLNHAHMIQSGSKASNHAETKLMTQYARSGSLSDALKAWSQISQKDLISWTAMITILLKQRSFHLVLEYFNSMLLSGIAPDDFTYSVLISACTKLRDIENGRLLHCDATKRGFWLDAFVGSGLVDLYAKCGALEDARLVFEKMDQRDVVAGTAMVMGYASNGRIAEAMQVFRQMPTHNLVSWNTLISGCTLNGFIDSAYEVFDQMPRKDSVSWNALIAGCCKEGFVEKALELFRKIPQRDRNTASWNALISGYAKNGFLKETVRVFKLMLVDNMKPNSVTITSALQAFSHLGFLDSGRQIHAFVIRNWFLDDIVLQTAVLDLYARCGDIKDACQVFEGIIKQYPLQHVCKNSKDQLVIAWTAMIGGYVQSGQFEEALKLTREMQGCSLMPNGVTFTAVLPACASQADLVRGQQIHGCVVKRGFYSEVSLNNALIDMYAKCGRLETSMELFLHVPEKDVISWNTMIAANARHGNGQKALHLFELMRKSEIRPDASTFVSVLSACCHAGLAEEGLKVFDQMMELNIQPSEEHYCCIADLLARLGRLQEAYQFIKSET